MSIYTPLMITEKLHVNLTDDVHICYMLGSVLCACYLSLYLTVTLLDWYYLPLPLKISVKYT